MPRAADRTDVVAAALDTVSGALTAAGIWHSLAFGTLLGAVRDNGIIAWDNDFDLFARPVDIPRILALNPALAAPGLEIIQLRCPGSDLAMNPAGVAWFDPTHLQVRLHDEPIGDLLTPSLFADGVLRHFDFGLDVYWNPHFSAPHAMFTSMDAAVIGGRRYPAIGAAEEFLTLMYGPDWRVPHRSLSDGGEPRDGLTARGHRYVPRLRDAIAAAEAGGWDRRVYANQPVWPRRVAGAGPRGRCARTEATSGALWWHDLDELVVDY